MGQKITIECDGDCFTHMPHGDGSTYATLCGLDGDDDAVNQRTVPTPRGAKIDCPQCVAIWQEAKRWRATDFKLAGK